MGPGARMEERSTWNILKVFIVAPILMGGFIVAMVVAAVVKYGHGFTAQDWLCQVAGGGFLGLAVMVALPTVGIAELRKRTRARAQRKNPCA
jgi:hypothetical protein